MRPVHRLVASVAGIAVALAPALMLPTTTAPAAGTPDLKAAGPTMAPLRGTLRRCDFSSTGTIATGYGSGYSVITSTGNTVIADVHIQNASANTAFIVRLIQLPRTGIRCAAGDPGTTVGTMYTNAGKIGDIRLEGPLMPGATNAFVLVEGPPGQSVPSGEFYSSDFAPKI